MPSDVVLPWIDALVARHTASLTTQELTRAVRALSARYVERRGELPGRSALDSAGKRAAFGCYYAPLHLLTTAHIVDVLGAAPPGLRQILDLGCGTGVAGAAWALACLTPPAVHGVETSAWALGEARWNWRQLGLRGRAIRGDMVTMAREWARRPALAGLGVVAAWSVNELDDGRRDALLAALIDLHARGASVLVVEPIAKAATPWWPRWTAAFDRAGGRADEWMFPVDLPPALIRIADAAGLGHAALKAKGLWVPGVRTASA
jgi:hypothetical protein